MDKRRVVVTGYGVLSCVGNNVADFWDSLVNGKCGIGPITRFDTSAYRTKIAGEVKNFDVSSCISVKEARRMDLFTQYAIAAADEALRCAGLNADPGEKRADGERFGCMVSSGVGGLATISKESQVLFRSAPDFLC